MNMHQRKPRAQPRGVSDTQTYSWIIRNVFFDAVSRDPFFANYTRKKTKMLMVQRQQLPYLGVYIVDDQMVPDGDANAGEVRFTHTLRIGYSVMVENNDADVAEQTIDMALKRIQAVLCNPHIMNVLDTFDPNLDFGNPDNTQIESITRGVRRHVWGSGGLNNETPYVELQYEQSCVYRENFPPIIPDVLAVVDVATNIGNVSVTYTLWDCLETREAPDSAAFVGTVA
jgi:hypothetical protein